MHDTVSTLIDKFYPDVDLYEELYRHLHANPELYYQEQETAKTVAEWLRKLDGFEVHTGVGYHGVVGVLRNGVGRNILLRAELDALPMEEKTGLPYASTKTMRCVVNKQINPVMHACGHDLHICTQLAACEILSSSRDHWHGTVVAIFQSAEEVGAGAKAMYDAGLFDPQRYNMPVPDVALGGHCMPGRAGVIKTRVGVINGSCDNFKVTMYGHGGHGARPHNAVDPVVLACSTVMKLQTIVSRQICSTVMKLQTIVSRQINPLEMAVITVGSIHAGSAPNIIPDFAVLELSIRAFNDDTRNRLKSLVTKFIDSEAAVWGCKKEPLYEQIGVFPIVDNDEKHTLLVAETFKAQFGDSFAMDATQSAGSEDFGALFGPLSVPVVFWNYGCIDADTWDKAEAEDALHTIASNHNPYFAPSFAPSVRVGLEAYAASALTYLK